jgi:hypothetical protein
MAPASVSSFNSTLIHGTILIILDGCDHDSTAVASETLTVGKESGDITSMAHQGHHGFCRGLWAVKRVSNEKAKQANVCSCGAAL